MSPPTPKHRARSPPENLALVRDMMRRGWRPPAARLIGFRLTDVARGRAEFELNAGPQHANPMGTLHGGILCDVADAAMGIAYLTALAPGDSFTTVELKINFLRPVWTGRLLARGKLIRKGRTLGLVECRITDERRRLVAHATSTCLTIPRGPGATIERARAGRSS